MYRLPDYKTYFLCVLKQDRYECNSIPLGHTHLLERAVHIVRHSLDLHLLVDQLVLDLVDPDVEPLDVHLRVLGSGLRSFKPGQYRVKKTTFSVAEMQ